MVDVFISYQHADRAQAERLGHALAERGVNTWWDFDLVSGDDYRAVIRTVIDSVRAAIVLWSPTSVESDFVLDEADRAKNQKKLCPALIGVCEIPLGFGRLHAVDLQDWAGDPDDQRVAALVAAIMAKRPQPMPETQAGAAPALFGVREMLAFRSAATDGSAPAYENFLRLYPNGAFAGYVRALIERLQVILLPDLSRPGGPDVELPPLWSETPPHPVIVALRPPPPEPKQWARATHTLTPDKKFGVWLPLLCVIGLLIPTLLWAGGALIDHLYQSASITTEAPAPYEESIAPLPDAAPPDPAAATPVEAKQPPPIGSNEDALADQTAVWPAADNLAALTQACNRAPERITSRSRTTEQCHLRLALWAPGASQDDLAFWSRFYRQHLECVYTVGPLAGATFDLDVQRPECDSALGQARQTEAMIKHSDATRRVSREIARTIGQSPSQDAGH